MTLALHENVIRRRIMAKMNQACNAVRDWRRLKASDAAAFLYLARISRDPSDHGRGRLRRGCPWQFDGVPRRSAEAEGTICTPHQPSG